MASFCIKFCGGRSNCLLMSVVFGRTGCLLYTLQGPKIRERLRYASFGSTTQLHGLYKRQQHITVMTKCDVFMPSGRKYDPHPFE